MPRQVSNSYRISVNDTLHKAIQLLVLFKVLLWNHTNRLELYMDDFNKREQESKVYKCGAVSENEKDGTFSRTSLGLIVTLCQPIMPCGKRRLMNRLDSKTSNAEAVVHVPVVAAVAERCADFGIMVIVGFGVAIAWRASHAMWYGQKIQRTDRLIFHEDKIRV
jgi:hypothetical protein